MNTPIVVKGLKNPDGTVITEFFNKKPFDFVAVKGADGAIHGLGKFKLSGKLIGLFEERNSVNELVSSNGAALYIGSDSDVITQWLQTGDVIYTRKFENNAWSVWTEDSIMTFNKMHFFNAILNTDNNTITGITGIDNYKDNGLFVGKVKAFQHILNTDIMLYISGAVLYVMNNPAMNEITQFLQINKDTYTRDFDGITQSWGDWEKNTFSVEGHKHFGDDIFVGLDDTSLTLQEFAEGHNHNISDVTGLQDALDGKANKIHYHTSEDISEILGSENHDGASLNEVIDGFDASIAEKANVGHTHGISDVTGLQDALDGKANVGQVVTPSGLVASLEPYQLKEDENLQTTDKTVVGAINEIRASHGTVIEFDASEGQLILTDQTPFGQMYHIDNSMLSSQINQIITTQEGGNNIHYHQNAGSMVADHFMIRVYRYDADYFVEIAGAWDNIVPPQE